MMHDRQPKKVTKKDRYGNQISYEYESEMKPFDPTALAKEAMNQGMEVPQMSMMQVDQGHPGEPMGSDTVPAWLTPGEFVVNKEATDMYGPQIEAMNDHGRALQANKGMHVPGYYQSGGQADSWWNRRIAGIPQHTGYIDDPDNIAETVLEQDPYGGKYLKDSVKRPGHYVDQATYYTPKRREYVDEAALRAANNAALKAKAEQIGFKFNDGGHVITGDTGTGSGWVNPNRIPIEELNIPQPKVPEDKISPLEHLNPIDILKVLSLYKNQGGMIPKYYNEGSWVTDDLLDSLAFIESSNNNDAVSKAGAVGKYQWLPSSAKQAGYGVKPFDPKDEKAARAATKKYLEGMAKHHGFTPEEALQAYNWGPGNVLKYKSGKRKDVPKEAQDYAGKIFKHLDAKKPPESLPTPRPENLGQPPIPAEVQQGTGSGWKDFLNKYVLGEKTQYLQQGNVVAPLTDVPSGHAMFGGNQNLGGQIINDPIEENAIAETQEPENKWWHNLLGHKSKEALGLQLDPNESRLYHEANPSLVGDDPAVAELDSDIEGTAGAEKEAITNVPGESLVGQVDDFNVEGQKKESDAEIVGSADGDVALKDDVQKKILNKINEAGQGHTGPGSDQKGNNASEKELIDAAEKDPSLVEQAGGFLKEAFGDLFDGKELARAAIMYAGSRALGYSHQGSLQHVTKNYLTRVDAKADAKIKAAATRDKRAFELAKTDKFTPASVSAYKKSGNPADLVSKKSIAGAVPTGVTEQRLVNGKRVSVQQVKLPDGSIGYNIPGKGNVTKAQLENATKSYDPSFDKGTSEYRTRRSRSVKSSSDIFKQIQAREDSYKKDDETKYNTDIIPAQAAQDFWVFAEKYGIDPESDEALDIMGQAYRQAIQQSSIEGAPRAKDLKPFLEAQYIRQQTSAPQLFQVNPEKDAKENAKYVRTDKMNELTTLIDSVGSGTGAKRNQIIDALVTDWGKLSEKEQKQWNRKANEGIETGFYLYAKDKAHNYLIDKKIGE